MQKRRKSRLAGRVIGVYFTPSRAGRPARITLTIRVGLERWLLDYEANKMTVRARHFVRRALAGLAEGLMPAIPSQIRVDAYRHRRRIYGRKGG